MTPIKFIGWYQTLIFSVDHAGIVGIIGAAASEEKAQWLAWSLGRAHGVPHRMVIPAPGRFADADVPDGA